MSAGKIHLNRNFFKTFTHIYKHISFFFLSTDSIWTLSSDQVADIDTDTDSDTAPHNGTFYPPPLSYLADQRPICLAGDQTWNWIRSANVRFWFEFGHNSLTRSEAALLGNGKTHLISLSPFKLTNSQNKQGYSTIGCLRKDEILGVTGCYWEPTQC